MKIESDVKLRLSLQRALLTNVTPDLRSVSADVDSERRRISLRFVFARPPSDSERDTASCVAAEVIADYPNGWDLKEEYITVPAGEPMTHLRLLTYHRCEDSWVGPDI